MPKKSRFTLQKLFNKTKTLKIAGENPKYIIIETYADSDDIRSMGKLRLRNLINKSEKFLMSNNADCIFYTSEFKEAAYDKYDLSKPLSFKIPTSKLIDAFEFAVRRNNCRKPLSSIAVSDEKLVVTDLELLKKMCFDTKKITVHTDNIHKAEALSELFFRQYGIYIEIIKGKYIHPGSAHAVIDADLNKVRVGDFVINRAEFQTGIDDICNINSNEIAAFLDNKNNLKIKNWISGKNIIKIS